VSSGEEFQKHLHARVKQALQAAPNSLDYGPLRSAAEMTGEEAASEIWRCHWIWKRDEHADYFEKWWTSLSPNTRRSLNVLVERFPDWDQWVRRAIRAQRIMYFEGKPVSTQEWEYRAFLSRLPRVSRDVFEAARKDRRRAEFLRNEFQAAAKLVSDCFGLKNHRPIENARRDRLFSILNRRGWSPSRIEQRCKANRPQQAEFGESTIRKAIKAHRDRSRDLHWALRIAIYVTGEPAFVGRK